MKINKAIITILILCCFTALGYVSIANALGTKKIHEFEHFCVGEKYINVLRAPGENLNDICTTGGSVLLDSDQLEPVASLFNSAFQDGVALFVGGQDREKLVEDSVLSMKKKGYKEQEKSKMLREKDSDFPMILFSKEGSEVDLIFSHYGDMSFVLARITGGL